MENFGRNVKDAKVYVKESNIDIPWWGITKNRIEQLKNSGSDYYIRFNSKYGSITLSSEQVDVMLKNLNVNGDGDYKIHLKDIKEVVDAFFEIK